MAIPVLLSKLVPPAISDHLRRSEILSRLVGSDRAHNDHRLTFLTAPAGWGKTVLLAQLHAYYAEQNNYVTSWLSLDRMDADPASFLLHLVRAIENAGIAFEQSAIDSICDEGERDSGNGLDAYFAGAIQVCQKKLAIFIDNARYLRANRQQGLLKSLLQQCPNLELFVASRRPDDALCAELAIRGQSVVIGLPELKFSLAEIEEITADVRPASLLADLIRNLDGWPIAVTHAVAMLSCRQDYLPVKAMDEYQRNLTAFVRAEITADLEPEIQYLYDRLCLFQRFSKDTVASVFDEPEAPSSLACLQHEYGLVQPDAVRHGWLSVPVALRNIARNTLTAVSADTQRIIHQRAFEWFMQNECIPEAIVHFEFGDQPEQLQSLIRDDVLIGVLLREGPAVIERVLRRLPDGVIAKNRVLSVTNALGKLRNNDIDGCRDWLALAKKGLIAESQLQLTQIDDDSSDTAIQVYLTEMIIKTYLDQLRELSARPVLDWVVGMKWTRARKFKGIAYGLQSLLQFLEGDFRRSYDSGKLGLQSFSAFGNQTLSELYCHVVCSLNAIAQADPRKADRYHQQAIRKLPQLQIEDLGLFSLLHLLEFEIQQALGKRLDPDAVLEVLDEAERTEYFADVFVRGYTVACKAAFLKDGFDAANGVVRRAMQCAARLKLPRLVHRMNYLKSGYLTICGDLESARKELKSCEAQVLEAGFWYERFCRLVAAARLQVAEENLVEASESLLELESMIDREMHLLCGMTVDAIKIQYLCADGQTEAMCNLLKSLLLQAETSGSRLPLFDEGVCLLRPLRILMSQHGRDAALAAAKSLVDELMAELNRSEYEILIASGPAHTLTDQERKVFYFVKQGLRNKVVAHELNLAEATVKYHLRNIYKKLSVSNRVQALAVTEGILDFRAGNAQGEKIRP